VAAVLHPQPPPAQKHSGRLPSVVAVLDMVAVAWMIAVGDWFDRTSRFTAVVTLGGHHKIVLVIALVGFVMLAGLAPLTAGFRAPSNLQFPLIISACMISVVALAGALAILLLAVAALLLILLPVVLVILLLLLLLRRR
jgi:hypothetical protein